MFFGVQLNPADAQAKDLPGGGDAHVGYQVSDGRRHQPRRAKAVPDRGRGAGDTASSSRPLADEVADVEGVAGAAAPPTARADGLALVEAFSAYDGVERRRRDAAIDRLEDDVLPAAGRELRRADTTSRSPALPTEEREFIDAVYGIVPVRARVRRSC